MNGNGQTHPEETGTEGSLAGRIEAILFVSGEAVSIPDLAKALQTDEEKLKKCLDQISDEYNYRQRGFLLKRFGNKVQLATRPLYAEDVVRLLQPVQQQNPSSGGGLLDALFNLLGDNGK